ncbi:MAG: cytochrome P450 [Allomuricauda sp.]|nr:MAG: cytochrome P450 [Allomuricauda sp.]
MKVQPRKTFAQVPFLDFLRRALEIVKNPLPFHHDNFEKKGDTFQLNLGFGNKIVFSRNASFLQYVLQKNQKNYTKSKVQTRDLAKYIGQGLLTAEGAHWKRQRKLIQPTFHKKHLTQLLGIMHETINEELSKIPVGKKVDIEPYFGRLAFQVVAKSLFSGAVDENTISRLQEIVEATQKMLVKELRQPYLGWWFKGSGLIRKHFSMVAEARQTIESLIVQRKNNKASKGDLLDMLLDARYDDGSAMEMNQMIDEILILFIAGHETTSNALTFVCQLLARHTTYQDLIFEENNIAAYEDDMTQLMGQKITKQVLEEAMRLYPPAYFIDRTNYEEDIFEGTVIPPATPLLFSVIEIHHSEKYWEDPEKFMPERFEGQPNQHSGYYFPFGAGPRMCIGNNFAMFEMQLVISELLKKFTISSNQKTIEILPLITLKPKNAILEFKSR